MIDLLAWISAAWPALGFVVIFGTAAIAITWISERQDAARKAKHRHPSSRSRRLP